MHLRPAHGRCASPDSRMEVPYSADYYLYKAL
jgi:hypothetical protein